MDSIWLQRCLSVHHCRDCVAATNQHGGLELLSTSCTRARIFLTKHMKKRSTELLVGFGETSSVSSDFRVHLYGNSKEGGNATHLRKHVVIISRGIGDGGGSRSSMMQEIQRISVTTNHSMPRSFQNAVPCPPKNVKRQIYRLLIFERNRKGTSQWLQ